MLGPSGIHLDDWLKEPFGSAVEVIEEDEFLVTVLKQAVVEVIEQDSGCHSC